MRKLEVFLQERFSNVQRKFAGSLEVFPVHKIITVKGVAKGLKLFAESDMVAFYDMAEDSKPLIVIERIPKNKVHRLQVMSAAKNLKKKLRPTFVVLFKVQKKSYDIIIMRDSILK